MNRGPFLPSFSIKQSPAHHLRSAVRRYEQRFGVSPEVVVCNSDEVPALRAARPDLRYQDNPAIAAGSLHLARNGGLL